MKQTFLLFLSFCTASVGFSQNEKELRGKVTSGETALANIDIVNMNSKKSTTTDSNGLFTLLAKADDQLYIISKEYTDRKIVLAETDFEGNFSIVLEKRPIELEDVNITRVKNMKIKLSEGELTYARIHKEANTPKVLGVNDGQTPGVNFIVLARQLKEWFRDKDKKKPKKAEPLPEFRDYIRSTFADSFFVLKLSIHPDEIGLFVSFCEADPKSKSIVATHDIFESMNFLVTKNEEFKKRDNVEK